MPHNFGLTHLDDVTMKAEQEVQGDLLSWQGVQTCQSRVVSSQLQQLKTFVLSSRQETRLTAKI